MADLDRHHVNDLDVGDELVDPEGKAWTIASLYREERFGMLVSITVECDGLPPEVLDAADEVRHDGKRWRIHPNFKLARHQGGA